MWDYTGIHMAPYVFLDWKRIDNAFRFFDAAIFGLALDALAAVAAGAFVLADALDTAATVGAFALADVLATAATVGAFALAVALANAVFAAGAFAAAASRGCQLQTTGGTGTGHMESHMAGLP